MIQDFSDFLPVLSRAMPIFFLFVNTYYESRFEFFDVFVKRATLFFLALVVLRIYFAFIPDLLGNLYMDDSTRTWVSSLTLIPFVITLPWIYRKTNELLDRFWIGRKFTPVEAVKYFLEGLQEVTSKIDLASNAANRLSFIFQAPVQVRLKEAIGKSQSAEFKVVETIPIPSQTGTDGEMLLGSRRNHTPYFAEDMTGLAALSDMIAYLLQNLNLQQKKQEQEIREQELILDVSRSELKALRAQINPHFLFNALNVIASLTQSDPDRAESTVEELAEVFRYTLSRSEQEWVRAEDEIEFIRAYLEVEKARFGDRLKIEIHLDDKDADKKIPTMMLQTLVENAVKHGVSVNKGEAIIKIKVNSGTDFLELEVLDNGPGPGERQDVRSHLNIKQKSGYGIKNIRSRLRGYFDSEKGFTLDRLEDQGMTRARIRIPLEFSKGKPVHQHPREAGQ
jgi:two-component sensor histidine kinase